MTFGPYGVATLPRLWRDPGRPPLTVAPLT